MIYWAFPCCGIRLLLVAEPCAATSYLDLFDGESCSACFVREYDTDSPSSTSTLSWNSGSVASWHSTLPLSVWQNASLLAALGQGQRRKAYRGGVGSVEFSPRIDERQCKSPVTQKGESARQKGRTRKGPHLTLKHERQRKVRRNWPRPLSRDMLLKRENIAGRRTPDVSQEVTRTMNSLLRHQKMTRKKGTESKQN